MSQSQQRLAQISSQLSPAASAKAKVLQKNPDDIVSEDNVSPLALLRLISKGHNLSYPLSTYAFQKGCLQGHSS